MEKVFSFPKYPAAQGLPGFLSETGGGFFVFGVRGAKYTLLRLYVGGPPHRSFICVPVGAKTLGHSGINFPKALLPIFFSPVLHIDLAVRQSPRWYLIAY